jgi:hypothetical protein
LHRRPQRNETASLLRLPGIQPSAAVRRNKGLPDTEGQQEMKVACQKRRCGWVGDSSELHYFNHPFHQDETVGVCPKCATIETSIWQACDEPECERTASGGTPTAEGYSNTCYEHVPLAGVMK